MAELPKAVSIWLNGRKSFLIAKWPKVISLWLNGQKLYPYGKNSEILSQDQLQMIFILGPS